jgi:LysR family transcriptional regulator of abg operon
LRNRTLDLAFAAFAKPPEDAGSIKEMSSFETVFVTRVNGAYARATSLGALQDTEWIHADLTGDYPAFAYAMHERAGLAPPRRVTRCTSYALFYSLMQNTDAIFGWTRHSLGEHRSANRFLYRWRLAWRLRHRGFICSRRRVRN